MRKQIAILAFFSLVALVVQAQDPIFSQFYAMPLQINPGFAGSSFAPRVGMAYRNQWTGFSNAYRTYALFYEQQLDHFNSGVGFNLQGDNAGDGILRSTAASVNYAYRLSVDDGLTLKLGIEAGARQVNLDWEKLVFPDQLDPINGNVLNSGEIRPDVVNRTMLDLVLVLQGMSGQMPRADRKRWRTWLHEHHGLVTDAVRQGGDPMPAVIDTAQWLQHFAKHPRSFIRNFVFNR